MYQLWFSYFIFYNFFKKFQHTQSIGILSTFLLIPSKGAIQGWNWVWNFWLSLVFSPNASYKIVIIQHLYAFTLSAMCFIYALTLIITILIILVNIQPYKKTAVRYPSTDPTFFVFLSITYSAILGMDLSHITNHADGLMFVIICQISACVPLCYIVLYICSWLVKVKGQIRC